jgi:hypothetical protein
MTHPDIKIILNLIPRRPIIPMLDGGMISYAFRILSRRRAIPPCPHHKMIKTIHPQYNFEKYEKHEKPKSKPIQLFS